MTNSGLDAYLAGIDPKAAPLVRALDEAVRWAHPDFEIAIKYQLLMYAIGGDWRHWVCAIGAGKQGVGLRFLYGVLLDDPRHVLRAGSSVLETWDFDFGDAVDAAAVGEYVTEAAAKYPEYRANASSVLGAARSAAEATGRRRVGG